MIGCAVVSYLLSVFTRINYWLTTLVTIERLSMVLFPTSTTLKKPRVALSLILLVIFTIFGMHVHEILHYTTIFDPSDPSGKVTLCVTAYTNSLISVYNRVNVLVHYFIPFISQVVSATILIIRTARSRQRTTGGQQTFIDLFKKQFKTQKEHYVTPIIIALSSLPQAILSFTYACTELKQAWQRYILLATYFLSYLPQILGFILYVLPSTSYKKEFQQTFIGKRLIKKTIST
ncbi:unnamed protein product [Didymodactylos carnosus]|uniref:G-protein coupled receptors family 1 profile domain-containing protein n=1 Tax=Didymodactylos carnosus TaxID=1234261 RepID=A0A814MN21_9BILA|nr:unnamed protein product [Didymodactylos carnosus]CAF1080139.1 unnamed protein product [Didymodactylos carnosus]CAF3661893.1 unnamed protein product [Didymodactylos carnosus]CAF3846182.1 unnamed protein product [Didymodactylos carnosus]